MSKKQHILFVLDFFPPHRGGVETVFANITDRLLAAGHTITIVTTRFDLALPETEKNKQLTIHRVGSTRRNFIRHGYHKTCEVLTNDPSIDLIHTSTYAGALPAVRAARRYHKKIILTVHEIFGQLRHSYKPRTGWLYYRCEKMLFWRPFDAYHCVSYYTYNALRVHIGLPDHQLHMIYNGIAPEWDPATLDQAQVTQRQQDYQMKGRFTALYYGHAGASKGIDYLLQAMPLALERFPTLQFVCDLIPSQRTSKVLKKLRAMPHGDRIMIIQGLNHEPLRHLIAAVDVVIAPSMTEGFGFAVAETCHLGTPLITTHASAVTETASGKVCLIPPSSAPAILQALADVQNGNRTTIPPKIFSRDDTVSKIQKLYQQVLANK